MIGMKRNLKQTLEIGDASSDPKIKLNARRIANDRYRYIMEFCTNASVVTEAMKVVTREEKQISTLQRQDKRTEQMATEDSNS
jgi:hypothetical protein